MGGPLSRVLLSSLVFATPAAVGGCLSGEAETGVDEQNLFERNCPHSAIDAALECDEPGYGELRFESHLGRYVLAERAVEEDLIGQQELSCRYAIDPATSWESLYVLEGEAIAVSSTVGLSALVARIPDLEAAERDLVDAELAEPRAVIRYELGFWGRGAVTYEGLSTGLETFRPSDSAENERAAKTQFVIDETAYNAGFGGTYATGLSCRLTLHPAE